jgi:hypothetical protein
MGLLLKKIRQDAFGGYNLGVLGIVFVDGRKEKTGFPIKTSGMTV